MPDQDENDAKNAICSGDFYPKSEDERRGQGNAHKGKRTPCRAKLGQTNASPD